MEEATTNLKAEMAARGMLNQDEGAEQDQPGDGDEEPPEDDE
jgi:hypothetical protein